MTERRARGRARAAVLLIDVINGFDFPGSAPLIRAARRTVKPIVRLTTRARAAGVPIVYVNDNFGRWRSDFRATVETVIASGGVAAHLAAALAPEERDYFVLKPHYSGFFQTPLDLLLRSLGVERVILCGFATNLCVLFTANDAYSHGYGVAVPRDCTAANRPSLRRAALEHVEEALDGSTGSSVALRMGKPPRAGRARALLSGVA